MKYLGNIDVLMGLYVMLSHCDFTWEPSGANWATVTGTLKSYDYKQIYNDHKFKS